MFRRYSKEEFIGFTEFLCKFVDAIFQRHQYMCLSFLLIANTGGLLGLFMGFSVVSIIEILYFLTIRPICAVRRGRTHLTTTDVTSAETAIVPKNVWNHRGRLVARVMEQRRQEGIKDPTKFRYVE